MATARARLAALILILHVGIGTRVALASTHRVLMLPLAPAQRDVPYALFPTAEDLAALTASLRKGISRNGVSIIQTSSTERAVSVAGFNQTNVLHACADPECATRIGRSIHADAVIYGLVTRATGVHWLTEVHVVSTASGKEYGQYLGKVVGDALSMQRGEDTVGTCIAHLILKQSPCLNDDAGPWM
jgi:hypothetical protein